MSETETRPKIRTADGKPPGTEQRVLVLAPFGRDAPIICRVLSEAGFGAESCADVASLLEEIERGAAAVLAAEEALSAQARRRISALLLGQPPWSDLPLLVMASGGRKDGQGWPSLRGIEGTAHLTLIERPLRTATLVSAVRVAVEARRRQYQIRTELAAREQAQQSLIRQSAIVAGINRIFHEVLRASDDERLGEVCLAVAEEITGSRIGLLAEVNASTGLLDATAVSNPAWDACRVPTDDCRKRKPMSLRVHGIYGRVLLDGRGVYTNDPPAHPDSVGLPPGHPPLEAFLGVPLMHNARAMGLVAVGNKPGGYGPDELTALEALAPTIVEAFARQRAEAEVRESEYRLSLAQEAAGVGVFDWDLVDEHVFWTPELCKIFGIPAAAYDNSYRAWARFVHPEDLDQLEQVFAELLESERTEAHWEYRIRRPDGEERWLVARAQILRDDDGKPLRMIGTNVDVTERKRAEEALRELNETLESQVAERTAIAERRARDLRRLAGELSSAEHRERRRLAKLLHDDLQQLLLAAKLHLQTLVKSDPIRLREEVARIDELLAESLDTSRSLSQDLSPPILQYGSLAEVVQWLCRWFGEKHGLTVSFAADSDLPAQPEHLRVFFYQALREMLMNVVKHSGQMTARVSLSCRDEHVIAQVEDHGRSFDPAAIEARLERPEGFGLFNIRERIEALQGRLEIQASDGGGACFRLFVPVAEGSATPSSAAAAPAAPSVTGATGGDAGEAGAIRLLVADDHAVVREGLVSALSGQPGIHVLGQAADGREAIEQALALRPDAIIMDVNMPSLDGIEATRRIKDRQPEIVIIGLSLHEEEAVAEAMTAAGADAFVSKHAPAKRLIEVLLRACRR